MLEASLKEAKQARRRGLIKLIIAITIILIVALLLLIFGMNCCSFNEGILGEADTLQPGVKQSEQITESISKPADPLARENYLKKLNQFQTEIEVALENIDLTSWQPEKANSIKLYKEQALAAFAESNYVTANEQIEQALITGEQLIQQAKTEYEQSMTAAQQAYEDENYQTAYENISNALRLNKQSQQAISLAASIEKLGEISSLLDEVLIARKENNLDKELSLIKEILAIEPEHERSQTRKKELVEAINQRQFAKYINQAHTAVDKGDAKSALSLLEKAMQLYPNRVEVMDLTKEIDELQRQQRIAEYSRQALAAMQQDDWEQAKTMLSKALNEKKYDKTMLDLMDKTNAILDLQTDITSHINNPYRLSEQSIKDNAKALINQSSTYQASSPKLKQQAETLSVLVSKMSHKVTVNVTSDNQTHIQVRGVGVVGTVEDKNIQLYPGEYRFEGKRTGYESKLVNILIPYDQPFYQVHIICDEPI